MLEFIDISKWNGVFNWQKAQAMGVKGAWLKASGCGIGGNYEDYRFKENSASCPLPYKGAYQYFDYEARKSGADQCKFFLDTVGNFGNLRGVLDIENNYPSWKPLSSVMGSAMKEALSWVTTYFNETGHWPILYLNTGLTVLKQLTATGYKYTFRNFTQCPLWVANYNNIEVPPTGAWNTYDAWQWTSGGDGYAYGNAPGNVAIDLNRIKNLNALLKPGITIEDPVVIPPVVEPTDKQKLDILWQAYKTYNK